MWNIHLEENGELLLLLCVCVFESHISLLHVCVLFVQWHFYEHFISNNSKHKHTP